MWLTTLVAALLLGAVSERGGTGSALGAPTPNTSSRLDDDETRMSYWKGWLLFDDPAVSADDGGRKKGQITPKSVFIAPVVQNLPDCAPGYRADALGRCHRIVKIDQSAQLGFLLQKLNAMYGSNNPQKLSKPATTEGPLQVAIPLGSLSSESVPPPAPPPPPAPISSSTTTTTTTEPPPSTTPPPTTPAPTEEVEMVVVAAEVQVKDEEHHSTSVPGAIVTLWHLNSTAESPSENLTDTTLTLEEVSTTVTLEVTTPTTTIMEITTTEEAPTTTPPPPTEVDDLSTLMTSTQEGTTITETTPEDIFTEKTEMVGTTDYIFSTVSEMSTVDETVSTQATTPPDVPPKTTLIYPINPVTSPPSSHLSVNKADNDVKIIDSSDSSESEDRPVRFDFLSPPPSSVPPLPSPSRPQYGIHDHLNEGVYYPPASSHSSENNNEDQRLRWPPERQQDEEVVTYPERQSQEQPSTSESGWSWGPWSSTAPSPSTQRPVYLNFWSTFPQVPDPTIKTRTGLRRPPSRYPATYDGRPAPMYYQELSGHDVANVFRHQQGSWPQQG